MPDDSQFSTSTQARNFSERRRNDHKRQIVAYGVVAGELNVVSGIEYLQSHGVEAHIIRRVALQLLVRGQAMKNRSGQPASKNKVAR